MSELPDSSRTRPPKTVRPSRADRRVGNPVPPIRFPEELPVSAKRDEIAAAITAHQVIIVCGETGSGKTTQLPKICLSLGRGLGAGGTGLIGHTQPRRIAASSTAKRIAEELGSPLGEHVGFKVRFHDSLSSGASVKLMTDGILLAETQTDRLLKQYDTIIIDEAHERSLNIDFLLGYLKQILPKRPDLKVIVTSATIDAERFSKHFERAGKPAPVIEVSGRMYAVEVRYRPVEDGLQPPSQLSPSGGKSAIVDAKRDKRDLIDALVDGVDEACACGPGDVLVFLPGEREIRDAAEALRKHHPPHTEILPLFARLSAQEQERVFKTSNARRIVLATNVAETSLTVPGIRYVVDTGLARVKRYSYRNKVEQLQIEPVAQSAANQRAGRCGRVAAGVCIRLYDEADFNLRPRFADPEIMRSSLAAVILRMKSLGLGQVEDFPFLEAPSGRAIADGYQLLNELGAVDEDGALTPTGSELARLPLDPRVGRMVLAAREQHCLSEMLIIASALSVQNPRDRPIDQQEAADNAHRKFSDDRSEFLSDLKLWQWFEQAVEHKKSNRQLRDLCRENFVSQLRLREWRDVHSQLHTTVSEMGWRLNTLPATPEQLHCALLSGLLGNIGCKSDEEAHYLGARAIKFYLWPGSSLAKKNAKAAGKWVMGAGLVETTRLYARTLARIEPEWIEKVGAHLLKKSYGDPHWEKKPRHVTAFERATLYGLVIYGQRRVDFGRLDAVRAREIFIRQGLVEGLRGGEFESRVPEVAKMLAHNRRLINDIEQLEHKARRIDVLVDDELIFGVFDQAIPAEVHNGHQFDSWYAKTVKENKQENKRLLYLDRDELMRHEAAGITTELFPKNLMMAGINMGLTYHFEPGSPRDGATLAVPLVALNTVDAQRCEWLVPGMLKEKVQLLLKSLPQKLRRHCVPLPQYAAGFCERHPQPEGGLIDALIADLREQLTITPLTSDFKLETLNAHHWMNFKVIDEHSRQLAMGRNLAVLRAELGGAAQKQFQQAFKASLEKNPAILKETTSIPSHSGSHVGDESLAATSGETEKSFQAGVQYTDWTFDALPELMEVKRDGQTLIGYPALVDQNTYCLLEVFDDPEVAAASHHTGLHRLFMLQLKEQIKFLEKNLPGLQQMAMQYMSLGTLEELRDQIIAVAVDRACMNEPLPTDASSFGVRELEGKDRLVLLANEIARLTSAILMEYSSVQKKIVGIKSQLSAFNDINSQVQMLIGKRFILETPYAQLSHFPRYLKAIAARVDKLRNDPQRDAQKMTELTPLLTQWQRTVAARKGNRDERLEEFRWLLEELRVALFAQELRTPMPVSVKRLQKIWESLR